MLYEEVLRLNNSKMKKSESELIDSIEILLLQRKNCPDSISIEVKRLDYEISKKSEQYFLLTGRYYTSEKAVLS
jgi:hypothetical protein